METSQQPPQPPNRAHEGNEFSLRPDIQPIRKFHDFYREFWVESKKLWVFAAPLIVITVCQHSLGSITQVFAGHVGTLQLAAVSMEDSIFAGLSYGVMMGMGSALETLCGQAYGAGQIDMLGIYLQRSWIILIVMGLLLTVVYVFATPILKLIGQDHKVADAVGQFALWMIPQIFALALNIPVAKFLQAQGKMIAMTLITVVGFVMHVFFSWLFMLKLGWGLVGAAVVLNLSWWLMTVVQILYIFSGACGRAWSGFSMKAFKNLWGFTKLSLASAVMLCLEIWYFVILILFAGYLKNAELAIDAMSICVNILSWILMVAFGFNAAISVRVSNELGAGHPRTAKFSVVVVVIVSLIIGVGFALIVVILRDKFPYMFTNSPEVRKIVNQLTPLLAITMVVNNVQPVLSGVAIGGGWQAAVAYVNIGCYYLFGIPLGLVLAYKIKLGITGLWLGLLLGTSSQTCVLFFMTCRTNWDKETSKAEIRINQWRGSPIQSNDVENTNTNTETLAKSNQSPSSTPEFANPGEPSNSHISES